MACRRLTIEEFNNTPQGTAGFPSLSQCEENGKCCADSCCQYILNPMFPGTWQPTDEGWSGECISNCDDPDQYYHGIRWTKRVPCGTGEGVVVFFNPELNEESGPTAASEFNVGCCDGECCPQS